MIKYADRGLVDQGSLSFMIEYLYYLANLFYWSIGLTIDFSKYLSKGLKAEKQMKFLKICSRMIEKNETIIKDKNENENHIHVVPFLLRPCHCPLPLIMNKYIVNSTI